MTEIPKDKAPALGTTDQSRQSTGGQKRDAACAAYSCGNTRGFAVHAVEQFVIAANRFGKTELERFNRERMADRHFLNVAAGVEELLEIFKADRVSDRH